MNLISKLTRFTAVAFLTLGLASCSDDDDAVDDVVVPETNTIADFVASNDDYSSLEAALEVTGLTATLDGTANYTVFAPDNDAFAAFLSENGFSDLNDVPTDLLTQVLMNHVQSGMITSGDLTTGYIESMAVGNASEENLSMYIDTSDGVMINGVSNVVTADVEVDNGIIHAVDAVIGLPDITTFAMADPTFDTLVAALTREDSYTFVETLMMTEDPAPFTVFAPTNDAFGALLEELEAESLNDISGDVLASVLSYHVVARANVRSGDLSDGMEVTMLNEDSITVNVGDTVTLTDSSGRTSTVVATDVQANNGVIHVLDMVLLPAM
jgi:uncharacterized surface protein with fasciclin (FAS1) repeats